MEILFIKNKSRIKRRFIREDIDGTYVRYMYSRVEAIKKYSFIHINPKAYFFEVDKDGNNLYRKT